MKKLLITGLLATAFAAPALATTIDFEDQSSGGKPNGYTVAGVTFTDTMGANLSVQNGGAQTNGLSLIISGDDVSRLQMDFATNATDISMTFGNDDPGYTSATDQAWLTLWLGGIQVSATSVTLNRNDVMDQSIGINGVTFDQAFFWYGNASGAPIGLIEAVDNITFSDAAEVPEPAMLGLFGLGAIGLGLARRRRA